MSFYCPKDCGNFSKRKVGQGAPSTHTNCISVPLCVEKISEISLVFPLCFGLKVLEFLSPYHMNEVTIFLRMEIKNINEN